MPLNIWQELANGTAPTNRSPRPKPKPKPKVTPRPPARSYDASYISSSPGGGPSVVPALPGTSAGSGGGGGSAGSAGAAPQSGASLLAQLKREAQSMVASELDPQIRARQFARGETSRDYRSQVAELQKRLGLTKTEITQLYGSADALLADNARKQQTALEGGKTAAAGAYDQLAAMVGQTYQKTGQDVGTELARLGQSGGDVTGRLAADKAFTSGQVGTQKAAATSTIDAIKAAAGTEGAQLRGATAATAPMLQSRASMAADTKKTELSNTFNSTMRQLSFQINELTGSRKGKEQRALKELQAAQAQAQQDAEQLNFLNQIKAAQLGISQGQLDLAKTRLGYDVQNRQDSLLLRAKELQAKLAGKAAGPQTGMERAYTYLGGYKGRVPQGQLQSALEDAINGNSNDPGWSPGKGTPGYDPKYIDQYRRDITSAVRDRGWSSAELQALLNAVGYYFRK